jgi:hypothetical protein
MSLPIGVTKESKSVLDNVPVDDQQWQIKEHGCCKKQAAEVGVDDGRQSLLAVRGTDLRPRLHRIGRAARRPVHVRLLPYQGSPRRPNADHVEVVDESPFTYNPCGGYHWGRQERANGGPFFWVVGI